MSAKFLPSGAFAIVYWLDAWHSDGFDPHDHQPLPIATIGHVAIHNKVGIQVCQDVGSSVARECKFVPTCCVVKVVQLVEKK